MIVADTNLISYLWLPGPQSQLAADCLLKDADWIAPLLWRSEFRNVLAGYFRKGLLDLTAAMEAAARAERMIAGNEFTVASGDILRLVSQSRCSAYDCEFVALAQANNTRLVTSDKQVLAEFPHVAIKPADFLALP